MNETNTNANTNANEENKANLMHGIVTPKLMLAHPNPNGTGAAIQFELKPAHGMEAGAIYCRIAKQETVADNSVTPPKFPTFDWQNAITDRFDIIDIGEILLVLRGESEHLKDGNGIFTRTRNGYVTVKLDHQIEPTTEYVMNFYWATGKDVDVNTKITFTPAEAIALMHIFESSLIQVAFGTGFEATSIAIAKDEARLQNAK